MRGFKKFFVLLGFSLFVAAPVMTVASPVSARAIDCETRILGIPPWFRGMTETVNNPASSKEECVVKGPDSTPDGLRTYVIKLALNIIEIGLVVVGYIALFFILYGGFQFLTGGANPGQIEKARTTILNAVIGLAISFAAVAIINLVFGVLG